MTNEEALEIIENDRMMFSEFESVEHDIAYGFAMEALEKQIPKKPFIPFRSITAVCRSCKGVIMGKPDFCPFCGQKLEWSDFK